MQDCFRLTDRLLAGRCRSVADVFGDSAEMSAKSRPQPAMYLEIVKIWLLALFAFTAFFVVDLVFLRKDLRGAKKMRVKLCIEFVTEC